MPHSSLRLALDAYNSSSRTCYPLNGSLVTNLEAVEYYLTKASSQLPRHQGVPITIANMQTFRGEVTTALRGYRQCLAAANTEKEQCLALSYLAVWHHYADNIQQSGKYLEQLRQNHPEQATGIEMLLKTAFRVLSQPSHQLESAFTISSSTTHALAHAQAPAHAIVALGHVLNDDGSITPELIQRLKLTLGLAQRQPESLIIVTGGLAKQGKTESQQMKLWLVEHGIEPGRIIEENRAVNTIDNARLSIELLIKFHVASATLVSSSIHVHRSQLLFETLAMTMNISPIAFSHCAVNDGLTATPTPTGQVRRNCYIDALRAYGLPAFNCEPFVQV